MVRLKIKGNFVHFDSFQDDPCATKYYVINEDSNNYTSSKFKVFKNKYCKQCQT